MSANVHEIAEAELDRERLALIAEVVVGRTYEEAAAAVGVSAKTVSRRMREPVFVAALTQARRDHLDVVVRRVSAYAASPAPGRRSTARSSSHPRAPAGAARRRRPGRFAEAKDMAEQQIAMGALELPGLPTLVETYVLYQLAADEGFKAALVASLDAGDWPDEAEHRKTLTKLDTEIGRLESELQRRQTDRERARLQEELAALEV
jgi:hypothetical protein